MDQFHEARNMSHVLLLNNPLKQITCTNTYTYNNTNKLEKSKFFVPVVRDYMELAKGVWNVSLDTYVIRNSDNAADTILDISTNLVNGFYFDKLKNTHETKYACLGKIFLQNAPNYTIGGPFEKKWFTVQSNRDFLNFELHVKQNPLVTMHNSFELDFEITLLFQRIK